ncbi:hypothetical protein SCOR_21940 [Sulfidibacter corallicola]
MESFVPPMRVPSVARGSSLQTDDFRPIPARATSPASLDPLEVHRLIHTQPPNRQSRSLSFPTVIKNTSMTKG